MSRYYGEVINLSLRDISMLKKFKIVDIKNTIADTSRYRIKKFSSLLP